MQIILKIFLNYTVCWVFLKLSEIVKGTASEIMISKQNLKQVTFNWNNPGTMFSGRKIMLYFTFTSDAEDLQLTLTFSMYIWVWIVDWVFPKQSFYACWSILLKVEALLMHYLSLFGS